MESIVDHQAAVFVPAESAPSTANIFDFQRLFNVEQIAPEGTREMLEITDGRVEMKHAERASTVLGTNIDRNKSAQLRGTQQLIETHTCLAVYKTGSGNEWASTGYP